MTRRSKSLSPGHRVKVLTYSSEQDKKSEVRFRVRHLKSNVLTDRALFFSGPSQKSKNSHCSSSYDRRDLDTKAEWDKRNSYYYCYPVLPDIAKKSSSAPMTTQVSVESDQARANEEKNHEVPISEESVQIEVTATVERVHRPRFSLFHRDMEEANDEYLLTLTADLDLRRLHWMRKMESEKAEFLFVLDNSIDMAGSPWEQIQAAMTKIIDLTSGSKRIVNRVVVYNWQASFIRSDELKDVKAASAGGFGTVNYISVFDIIKEMLLSRIAVAKGEERASSSDIDKTIIKMKPCKLYIFFVTSGHDNCNLHHQVVHAKEKLRDVMKKYGQEIVINVIGFSKNHNYTFVKDLATLTSRGSYSYIRQEYDDETLEMRLVNLAEATVDEVEERSVFLGLKLHGQKDQFLGNFFTPRKQDITLEAFVQMKGNDQATIQTSKFIELPKGAKKLGEFMSLHLLRNMRDESEFFPCFLDNAELKNEEGSELALRKIRAALNLIAAGISRVASEGTIDDENWQALESWFKVIEEASEEVKVSYHLGKDFDSDSLWHSVQTGLRICGQALDTEVGESIQSHLKRASDAVTRYNLATGQMYNNNLMGNIEGRSDRQSRQAFVD